eukprot:jgi/Mesvir1/26562/Mv16217-RA.1
MWSILSNSDNYVECCNGPNYVFIGKDSKDSVSFESTSERWSFDRIKKRLGKDARLYDILKPLASGSNYSIGVYCGSVKKGINKMATGIIDNPVSGDVLMMKTFDDGDNPTVVGNISPDEFHLAVRAPRDIWVKHLCAQSTPVTWPVCTACATPYVAREPGAAMCTCR